VCHGFPSRQMVNKLISRSIAPRSGPSSAISLRQMRHNGSVFDEFAQSRHDSGAVNQPAKNINFPTEVFVWNWFYESFCRHSSNWIESLNLGGGRSCRRQRLPVRDNFAEEANGHCFVSADGTTSQKQIAHHTICEVPLKPRDATSYGDESETQFRKAKPRRLIGDDEVANQGEFKTATKTHASTAAIVTKGNVSITANKR